MLGRLWRSVPHSSLPSNWQDVGIAGRVVPARIGAASRAAVWRTRLTGCARSIPARLDPVEIGRKGGQAPRASVVPLQAKIRELEAELWRTGHALEQAQEAGAGGQLAATLALIDAL